MFRLPSLLFAAALVTSAWAFAGDTPDPSATKGEPALPSGSKADAPSKPPASNPTDVNKQEDKTGVDTTPSKRVRVNQKLNSF